MDPKNYIYMYIENEKLNIDKIANEYTGYLWKIIVNSGICDEDIIKDIISDTFLTLWRCKDKLDVDKPLPPFLAGITKILIKRYFSSSQKSIENNIDDYENMLLESEKVDLIIEQKEVNNFILKILDTFRDDDKEIFRSYYYEEKTVKEIAIQNNFSESKVKTKLHRLRNKIRKELLKGGYSINE